MESTIQARQLKSLKNKKRLMETMSSFFGTNNQKQHLLILDGLRAIACLAVLLHHIVGHVLLPGETSGLWSPVGNVQVFFAAFLDVGESAVILFFLLSSFLLFLPFARTLLFDHSWPSLSRFYIRRFFRILPGYYTAIILMVLLFHRELLDPGNQIILFEFFTFSMGANVPVLLNGPFWTMAVEFQFYLLLPLIAWVLSFIVRRGTRRWRLVKLTICLFLLLGWGLLSRFWGLVYNPSFSVHGFPQHILAVLQPYYYGDNGKYFEVFATGMILAMLYMYTQSASAGLALRVRLQQSSSWLFFTGVALLACMALWHLAFVAHLYPNVLASLAVHQQAIDALYQRWQSLCYSLCYGLCMAGLLYNSSILKRPFEWIVLRWIGLISFSLYMWHFPLLLLYIGLINQHFQHWSNSFKIVGVFAWTLLIIFPVSVLLYRLVEMPGMRLGEKFIQRIQPQKRLPSSLLAQTAEDLRHEPLTSPPEALNVSTSTLQSEQ